MEEMYMMKVHGKGSAGVMALSDPELIGRTLKGEDIDLKVTRSFYEGDLVSGQTVLRTVPIVGSVNAIGARSVGLLLENGIITEENLLHFGTVPHIQLYNIVF